MSSINDSDLFQDMAPISAQLSISNEIELELSQDFFLNKNEITKQANEISCNESFQKRTTHKIRKPVFYLLAILIILVFSSIFIYFQLNEKVENSNKMSSNPVEKLENEVGLTNRNSKNNKIQIPLKSDGTPDMRYKVNKELFGNSDSLNENYSISEIPLKSDGTPDMRYKINKEFININEPNRTFLKNGNWI